MPDRSSMEEPTGQVELPRETRGRWSPQGDHAQLQADRRNTDLCKSVPFVSVIMPIYNEENYVRHAVQQALQQTYPDDRLELIIADGMSTDRTRDIIAELQEGHPNIRMIDNPGRAVSPGLNRALAVARGDIIVRLDGHCEYPANYIHTLVALREEHGADSVARPLVQRHVGQPIYHNVCAGNVAPPRQESGGEASC